MKKSYSIFACLLLISLMSSCKTVHEVLANRKFNNKIGVEELARPVSENVYPFTLDSEFGYGCPIVNFPLNGQDAYFLVDTGCPDKRIISNNGLEKLGYDVHDFQLNVALPIFMNSFVTLSGESKRLYEIKDEQFLEEMRTTMCEYMNKGSISLHFTDNQNNEWSYGFNRNMKNDGILGFAFLQQYERATFDFINNELILGDEKIEGNTVPLLIVQNQSGWTNHPFIKFTYKGKEETGLIDTGNYTFSPRSYFGDGKDEFNPDLIITFEDVEKTKIKKRAPIVHTYKDIEICGVEFNKIKGVYSTIWFSTYSKPAQISLQYVNGLGCEFFRSHVIQFDFENNEFLLQ